MKSRRTKPVRKGQPKEQRPGALSTPRKFPIATLISILALFGAAFAYLEKISSDCKVESSKAIDQQEKLRAEIMERRETFVQMVARAASINEVRDFLSHHDNLHGYIFREFSDRSLVDLESEEQRNGQYMDEPSFFALDLKVEFIHAEIQASGADARTIGNSDPNRIWEAVKFQDVSLLGESDLPELKRVAGIEWGWLFKVGVSELQRGRLVSACGIHSALVQLVDDVLYLNRPAIHVIYEPSIAQPTNSSVPK